jgi:hypothetical protein
VRKSPSIISLLEKEGIPYRVQEDQSIQNANDYSMQNNLRHLNSPSISNHILAIKIEEKNFENMSADLKQGLLDFGITHEVPEGLEYSESESPAEELLKDKHDGDKRLIGFNFLYQMLVGLGALGIYFLIKYLVN